MLVFINRKQRGPDPWISLKITLFFAGAAFGFAGMAMEEDWPVLVGIVLLLLGASLRFLPTGEHDGDGEPGGS